MRPFFWCGFGIKKEYALIRTIVDKIYNSESRKLHFTLNQYNVNNC